MVDLPEAERPVSQIVRPFWLRREERSERVSAAAWYVMFLFRIYQHLLYRFCIASEIAKKWYR